MDYILSKFAIKPGKREQVEAALKKWHQNSQGDMAGVLDEARITLDCSFIATDEGRDTLFIFKRLKDVQLLKERIRKSDLKIYEEIRAWAKECLEEEKDISAIAVFDRL